MVAVHLTVSDVAAKVARWNAHPNGPASYPDLEDLTDDDSTENLNCLAPWVEKHQEYTSGVYHII